MVAHLRPVSRKFVIKLKRDNLGLTWCVPVWGRGPPTAHQISSSYNHTFKSQWLVWPVSCDTFGLTRCALCWGWDPSLISSSQDRPFQVSDYIDPLTFSVDESAQLKHDSQTDKQIKLHAQLPTTTSRLKSVTVWQIDRSHDSSLCNPKPDLRQMHSWGDIIPQKPQSHPQSKWMYGYAIL
jgi:hypothetical protein